MENNMKVSRAHRALSILYALLLVVILLFLYVGPAGTDISLEFISFGIAYAMFPVGIHYLLYRGAKSNKKWSCIGTRVVGVLMLLGFPIGTIIGIYLLVNSRGWEYLSEKSAA